MKPINQKEFYERVELDENGNVKVVIVPKSGNVQEINNQYDFFMNIEITEEGYLKVYQN